MFVVLLKVAGTKGRGGEFIDGHKAWIQRGFDDGVFLLSGSLLPPIGGAIIAHNTTLAALQDRVHEDPFVAQGVVSAEVLEITPSRVEAHLQALLV